MNTAEVILILGVANLAIGLFLLGVVVANLSGGRPKGRHAKGKGRHAK
jgi:hypothetical protein